MPDAFSVSMLVALVFGVAIRESCMTVVTGVLISNWLLCVMLTAAEDGQGVNWFGLGVIDFASALVLLILAHRKWQMAVVGLYVVMIACHIMRWWSPLTFNVHNYLLLLSLLSWAQLATVMGRGGHVILRSTKGDAPVRGGLPDPVLHQRKDGGAS